MYNCWDDTKLIKDNNCTLFKPISEFKSMNMLISTENASQIELVNLLICNLPAEKFHVSVNDCN